MRCWDKDSSMTGARIRGEREDQARLAGMMVGDEGREGERGGCKQSHG
jgi:hypothetical protein